MEKQNKQLETLIASRLKTIMKKLPEFEQHRIPEKIRQMANRTEQRLVLEAIALGLYLDLEYKIQLTDYTPDKNLILMREADAENILQEALRENDTPCHSIKYY